jgi:hypothetical protein
VFHRTSSGCKDKADAFKAMAIALAKADSKILIGNIGISTYGDMPNQDMARRFEFIPEETRLAEFFVIRWWKTEKMR